MIGAQDGTTGRHEACPSVESGRGVVAGRDVKDDPSPPRSPGLVHRGIDQRPADTSATKAGIHPDTEQGAVAGSPRGWSEYVAEPAGICATLARRTTFSVSRCFHSCSSKPAAWACVLPNDRGDSCNMARRIAR